MEGNNVEQSKQTNTTYTAGLVVGILSIPCGWVLAISGWILGIVGIVLNLKKKTEYKTTVGLVLSIIGLVGSIINSILGYLIVTGVIG